MGIYFESFLTEVILAIIFVELLILLYFQRSFSYWKRKKIASLPPVFPFGNLKDVFLRKEMFGVGFANIHKELKRKNVKYGGCYMLAKPIFVPIDPEIIKYILIKDFSSFQDRGVSTDEINDPLSAHLFSIGGDKWRMLRTKLSPTFTSGKIKNMFQTLAKCGETLQEVMDSNIQNDEPVDIKDFAARFTTDIISSCAFGIETSSLRNPDDEFRKHGEMVFDSNFYEGLKLILTFILPSIFDYLPITMIKPKVSKFFLNIVYQTVEYREKNNIHRKDMLDLLLKLKNNQNIDCDDEVKQTNGVKNDTKSLTLNELAAQCYVFFLAGFETSSTVMTFCLFELAQNQDIQNKLREEIQNTLHKYNGEITYDAIMEMTYMDKVINETMRKYPPLPFLNRTANSDWTIPGTNTVIEKGTAIFISNMGLHMDPEYYPEPEKFNPERFSEEEKNKRPGFTFLPFGDGPRNCIGMRFGFLQTKVGIANFLKNYKFTVDEKTILPIIFDLNSIILTHRHGIWLKCQKV